MNTNQKYAHTTSELHSKSNLANKGHTTHTRALNRQGKTEIERVRERKRNEKPRNVQHDKRLMIGSYTLG